MEVTPASTECPFLSGAMLIMQSHRAFRRKDRELLHRLHVIVEQRYEDSDFGLIQLAAAMEISERQVQRKIKVLTSFTPSEYLRNQRLQRSLCYLNQGDPVGETARRVGFASQSYFTSCFKARYCLTPTEFQQQVLCRNPDNFCRDTVDSGRNSDNP